VLLLELIGSSSLWKFSAASHQALAQPTPAGVSNTEALGRVLYTDYIYYFQIAGLVLLVAMIGAIVLTLRHRSGVRRQNIGEQNARVPSDSMIVVDVKPGKGA
jgi:NADH-quinone oxidoreductase subunit J